MRAHEFLSAMVKSGIDTDFERDLYNDCMAAVKFDLGDMENANAMTDLSSCSFFDIPYPICLFQAHWKNDSDYCLFLAKKTNLLTFVDSKTNTESNDVVVWRVLVRAYGKMGLTRYSLCVPKNGGMAGVFDQKTNKFIENQDEINNAESHDIEMMVGISKAVEVFSCTNVTVIEHQPPKFINSLRTKKGKVPFFSYRTLHITGERTEIEGDPEQKGTHASPRLHLRRGHIRRLPNGTRTWVRHCLVGDKSKGLALHDYHVNLQPAAC